MTRGEWAFLATGVAFFVWMGWYIVFHSEPRRDARLDRQLEIIRTAETVDDLRPLLEEFARRQRNDYR